MQTAGGGERAHRSVPSGARAHTIQASPRYASTRGSGEDEQGRSAGPRRRAVQVISMLRACCACAAEVEPPPSLLPASLVKEAGSHAFGCLHVHHRRAGRRCMCAHGQARGQALLQQYPIHK